MISDNFSWRRVGMVGQFYFPRLKWQLIAYPIAAICLTLLTSVLIKIELPAVAIAPFSSIISYMVSLGPLFFTAMAAREVETSLPATNGEKTVFMILYSLIIIPLLVWIPQWLIQLLMFGSIAPISEILQHTMPSNSDIAIPQISQLATKSIPTNILSSFAVILVCLCTVVTLKRNRIILSIVFCIVYQIVITIVTSIYIGAKIVNAGIFQKIASGKTTSPDAVTEEITKFMTTVMPDTIWLMGGLNLIACIVLTYLIYRGIKRFEV